jgi:hypothetical protein
MHEDEDLENDDDLEDDVFSYYDENDELQERKFSALEKEFLKIQEDTKAEIDKHISQAKASLREAVRIADERGMPFRSAGISFLSNTYVPETFYKKFPKMDRDWLSEVADIYTDGYDIIGWRHSAVC